MGKLELLSEERMVHFHLDLWGCSSAFIEGVAKGASKRGAAEVEDWVCSAAAVVKITVTEDKALAMRTYLRRIENLAQYPMRRQVERDRMALARFEERG